VARSAQEREVGGRCASPPTRARRVTVATEHGVHLPLGWSSHDQLGVERCGAAQREAVPGGSAGGLPGCRPGLIWSADLGDRSALGPRRCRTRSRAAHGRSIAAPCSCPRTPCLCCRSCSGSWAQVASAPDRQGRVSGAPAAAASPGRALPDRTCVCRVHAQRLPVRCSAATHRAERRGMQGMFPVSPNGPSDSDQPKVSPAFCPGTCASPVPGLPPSESPRLRRARGWYLAC
jgi:hypothetical protein